MLRRVAAGMILALATLAIAEARDLEASYAAADLETLAIAVAVGEVRMQAGSEDTIRVEVELLPTGDADSDVDALIDDAELAVSRRNGRIQLEVVFPDQPGGTDDEPDIQQKWRVVAPGAVAASVEMGVGRLDISGLEGGIDATLGVGEIQIDVPRGSVRLKTSVGEVSVLHAARSVGDVDLDSNIGEVSLRVDGDDIDPERSMFVGSRLHWSGDGNDDIDVRVNVGQIVVRLD